MRNKIVLFFILFSGMIFSQTNRFIYQLDIATLPEEYKTLLGGKGVLQFFYDFDNYEDGELARIVYPNEDGAYHTQPYTKKVYLIDNKKPQQQIIKSWKSHIDYPFTSEEFEDDEEMCDLWNEICDHEKFDEDKYITISGDKLGGYALFSQAGYPSNGLIYQIQFDEDNEHIEESKNGKEQRNLKSHAPNLISSDGTCFLFIEEFEDDDGKISTEFTFDWACG